MITGINLLIFCIISEGISCESLTAANSEIQVAAFLSISPLVPKKNLSTIKGTPVCMAFCIDWELDLPEKKFSACRKRFL